MDDDPPGDDRGQVPLPAGARVTFLGDDLALLELPLASARLPQALTEAERAVAEAVFAGASNQEIAAARAVSVKTVQKQLEAIFRKLSVTSRAELVLRLRDPSGR